MNKQHWIDLAAALGDIRRRLEVHADRARSDLMFIAHRERALGIDLAARVACRVLRRQSRRFDPRAFMRIYSAAK